MFSKMLAAAVAACLLAVNSGTALAAELDDQEVLAAALDDDVCEGPESECAVSLRQLRGERRREAPLILEDEAPPQKDGNLGAMWHPPLISTVHFVGDIHADNNFLIRSLLSTQRFTLKDGVIEWKPKLPTANNWEIVITGDMIDKGDRSSSTVLTLKRLSEDPVWGSRLNVLKGNHESGLLMIQEKYINATKTPNDEWKPEQRFEDIIAQVGQPGNDLITWLVNRPVAYFGHGILAMHGGMSQHMAAELSKEPELDYVCKQPGNACGSAMVEFVNRKSVEFYRNAHFCMMRTKTETEALASCNTTLPYFLAGENKTCGYTSTGAEGLINYRGWSENDCIFDSGSRASCASAAHTGMALGADVMVVAHTTHRWIRELCKGSRVKIFNTDVHFGNKPHCGSYEPQECDLAVNHTFHNLTSAQSLTIQQFADGRRFMYNCTSKLQTLSDFSLACTRFT